MGAGPPATLDVVVAAIDPGLAGSGSLTKARAVAHRVLETADVTGIVAVPWSDTRYPTALAAIADPPPFLGVRGDSETLGGASSARERAPRMPVTSAGRWDPDWLNVASQLSAGLHGVSTRRRIRVRWLWTVVRLAYWAPAWTSCTLPSTVGWARDVIRRRGASSANCHRARHRGRHTFRNGIVSSAVCPGRSWWSRRPNGSGP